MLAVVDPKTLGLNLWLIIGGVILAVFLLVFLLAAWTGLNVGLWQLQRRRAERALYQRQHDAAGRPLPPSGRGICDACHRPDETVYHLPGGERRCPTCYAELDEERA
jgi:hypothetical protein